MRKLITLITIIGVFSIVACKKSENHNLKKETNFKKDIKNAHKKSKEEIKKDLKMLQKNTKLVKTTNQEDTKFKNKKSKFERKIVKSWVEPVPGNEKEYQGFKLNEDGTAESINMATLKYKTWEIKDNKVTFVTESIGNGNSAASKDTYKIESMSNTTLRLSMNGKIFKYKNYKYIKDLKEMLKGKGVMDLLSDKKDETLTLTKNGIVPKKNKYSRKELERKREEKKRAMQEAIRNRGSNGKNRVNSKSTADGDRAIAQAFKSKRSDIQVETYGIVVHILPDDTQGHKHQKFILKLKNGRTILIAHNIDLAPKIKSLKKGDRVDFRGEYEWSDRGGVVHWTHKDPGRRHEDGWLKHNNKIYQ